MTRACGGVAPPNGWTTTRSAIIGGAPSAATRQSLHYWEDNDRESPQSRVIDTLLRLVRESLREPRTDVVGFLHTRATSLGIDIARPAVLDERRGTPE